MLQPVESLIFKDFDLITYIASTISNLKCKMDFATFPFDTQRCPYYVLSSSFRAEDLVFQGRSINRLESANFHGFDISLEDVGEEIYTDDDSFNKSRTGFVLILERRPSSYVFKYFLPAFGIVLVSWISFLIPPEVMPARTGLLVTLFLVLTTVFGNIQV